MTDCRQIRDLLESYLAGELLVETNHAVLEHVGRCSACARELERRQRLLALLRDGLRESPAAAALQTRVATAIDRERRWLPRTAGRWTAAASVLLATAAVVAWHLARSMPVDAAAYRDSVGEHIECGLTTPAGAVYNPARVARRLPSAFAPLAQRFLGSDGDYHIVDAHACPYQGRRYVHFVFRRGARTVSLFVDDHPRGALPRLAPADEGPFHIDASATARHQIFVVGERGDPDAATRAHDLLTPSVAFVQELERVRTGADTKP